MMKDAFRNFKQRHSDLFEFIMFNLFSNIATIVNFAVLIFSRNYLFSGLSGTAFRFWIYDYSVKNGGLAAFLSFLLSFFIAQAVNFVVQRKIVFGANNSLRGAVPIYLLTVLAVYLICLYIPTIALAPLTGIFGVFWAANLTNMINIIVQVLIIYPVLKFAVMKKEN